MGTKVQCKSYFPGYYSMGNLNEDTNSSWYYEDKTASGHLYTGFMLKPVNGYSVYDKEMLKRTMLEHEAIFRKQVYELHRLYRIQKDLMDELKMKELYRFSVPFDTSRSNLFSSPLSSEVTEQTWQMPHLTTGNTSYNRASVSSANEMKAPINFLKENSGPPTPSINGASLKDGELLDSKRTKFPRKMFDLQLPADVYIDNEDAERAEKENVSNSSLMASVSENDVKLTPGEGRFCRKGSWKSDSHPQNGMPMFSLDDLNEPIKDICCEGEPASDATHFRSDRTHHEGMQGHQLPSNTSHLHRDFFTLMHREEGACSNLFSEDKEETKQELPLFHNEVGQGRRDAKSFNLDLSRLPMTSKPIQLTLPRAREISLHDQNKTETWFGDRTSNGIEISGRSPHLPNSTYSGPTVPTLSPFEVLPHSDHSSTASSLVSSWRKPIRRTTHIPIAVQALPCFNRLTAPTPQSKSSCVDVQNLGNACGKWQCNDVARPNPACGSEISSSLNDFHHDFRSNSNSSKRLPLPAITFPIPNLNSHGGKSIYKNSESRGPQNCFKPAMDVGVNWALTNGIRDGLATQQDVQLNHEDVSGISRDYCQYGEIKKMQERGKGPSLWALQDLPSSSSAKESRMQRIEVSDGLNVKRILGFPILDSDSLDHNDLSCDLKVSSSPKLYSSVKDVGNSSKGLRNHINLNSVISYLDVPNSSENSPDDEAGAPPPLLVPNLGGEVTSEIDMEVPITIPVQIPLGKTDVRQETECSHGTLVGVAAENLVAMSLDLRSVDLVLPDSCHSLRWLAEVVSSKTDSSRASKGGGQAESSDDDDGLDYFESMTLKLEAMKVDEYRRRPWETENRKDEGMGTASLLLTRPRRGQGRKRRQRRDFQKDILPGLASLSRNEVTEDLRAIGALMRSSSRALKAGLARQSTRGTGFPCQARGRRQPRSLAVTVAEIRVDPAPPLPTQTESELDGRTVTRWGRTTRRCRRQRVPSGNTSALLT